MGPSDSIRDRIWVSSSSCDGCWHFFSFLNSPVLSGFHHQALSYSSSVAQASLFNNKIRTDEKSKTENTAIIQVDWFLLLVGSSSSSSTFAFLGDMSTPNSLNEGLILKYYRNTKQLLRKSLQSHMVCLVGIWHHWRFDRLFWQKRDKRGSLVVGSRVFSHFCLVLLTFLDLRTLDTVFSRRSLRVATKS